MIERDHHANTSIGNWIDDDNPDWLSLLGWYAALLEWWWSRIYCDEDSDLVDLGGECG